ncbi:MAG: hypothetical protein U0350_39960 [Caldilineaceae bacterium]
MPYKNFVDVPMFRPLAPAPLASAAGASMAYDERPNADSDPYLYLLASATGFYKYSPKTDGWIQLGSPALAGTFGAGAGSIFHPTQGSRGILAAGNTATKIVLSTPLPAAVGINQLANRGDGTGYKIRIVGNAALSSGQTGEAYIVANTAGTTPTIWLASALPFAPFTGDAYEILSGRIFLLGAGAVAAGIFKYYDVATNSFSGSLSTTNLPATISTDSALFDMSEANVPNTLSPGQGYFGTLIATASAAGSLTGQASNGDASVVANEYRNFQIRVIQDTTTPTAVGQRRRIASHTAGPSAVYTLATNWAVTPSPNAQFVVEYDDDKLLLWSSAVATTYTYNISANAWDTTTFGAKGGASGAGTMAFGAWAITPDTNKNARPGMIHVFRGGAVATIDVLDITGGANGSWDNAIVAGVGAATFTTGSCGVYDPAGNAGRYAYINLNGGQNLLRYDVKNRVIEPYAFLPVAQSTAIAGGRMALCTSLDTTPRTSAINLLAGTGTALYQCWLHN